jgi:hypothetical protein
MNLRALTPLLVLNVVSIVFYFWMVSIIGIEVNFKTMFATNDAITYRSVAHWITDSIQTDNTAIRPILYPIFLAVTSKIGGVYAIWFFQFTMWLISINVTFLSVQRISKSIIWGSFAAFILITNLSLIALTFHALTELITVFLLSITIYLCVKNHEKFRSLSFFRNLLILFVLLTLVKPTFYLPLLGLLFVVLPLFYFKSIFKNKKNLLVLAVILTPLIFQMILVKKKHNEFAVSKISGKTVNEYILAQSIVDKHKIERDSALIVVASMTSAEKTDFIKQNLSLVTNRFKMNLEGNINSAPIYLMSFIKKPNQKLIDYMAKVNQRYYKWHRCFLFLLIPFLLLLYRKKDFNMLYIALFFSLLNIYYILVTGISFWQGDRLTLSALGIFAFLYVYMLHEFFTLASTYLKSKFNSRK